VRISRGFWRNFGGGSGKIQGVRTAKAAFENGGAAEKGAESGENASFGKEKAILALSREGRLDI
jgi:hypothetical protein